MKKIILLSVFLISQIFYAQTETVQVVKDTTYWTKKGTIAVLGSQSSFSQWQAGWIEQLGN